MGKKYRKCLKKVDEMYEYQGKNANRRKLLKETVFKEIKKALDRQFSLADNYSIELKPVEPGLLTDMQEIESGREYLVNENKTSLLQKLNEVAHEMGYGVPASPILVTGEGGNRENGYNVGNS